ncbi:hypothetical protein [Methanobrevibacter sp.]|uniref:hypothetical protein n=1 Tax=Methanobrevibacter sp. TaxID=66852 RepID=UPI00388EBEF9
MARQVEYVCENCGYSYTSIDKIFWIDETGQVIVKPLVKSTSAESHDAPVKGFFTNYYCYDCKKFVDKFIIFKKSLAITDAHAIHLIERYSDNPKIVQFDDAFQRCLTCGNALASRADYSFALDTDGEFHIGEGIYDFSGGENHKFAGTYHGYFCSKCKKQINKFVITENNANLTDSELKDILKEHTNDLTIFIRRDFEICPNCGEEIYYLDHNSTCPNCKRDRLIATTRMRVD